MTNRGLTIYHYDHEFLRQIITGLFVSIATVIAVYKNHDYSGHSR